MGDLWLTQWHCDRVFTQFFPVNSIRSMVHTNLYNIIAAIGRTSGRSLRTFKQTGRRWRETQFHAVSCFLVLFLDIHFQLPSSTIAFLFPTCYGGTSNDTGVSGESVRVVQTDRQTDRQTTRTVRDVLLVTNSGCRVTAFRPFGLVAGKLNRHIELGWFDG